MSGRDRSLFETTHLGASPAAGAPKLPNRRKLQVETREWWDDWAGSPQASQFGRTDWRRLLSLVPLVEAYWRAAGEGDSATLVKVAAELRQQEGKLGATPEDRMRLRWSLREPAKPAPVAEDGEKDAGRARSPSVDPRKLAVVKAG